MRQFCIIILAILVIGCDSNDAPAVGTDSTLSLSEIDLTGTWVLVKETRYHKTETSEYLYSDFVETKYVLEETSIGVKYEGCSEYGGFSPYGVKTENNFYMNLSEQGYSLQADGTLTRTTEFVSEFHPGFNLESIETLRKVSTEVAIDNGTFVLNGPVSIAEYNHVCLFSTYSNIGDRRTVEIIVPFDNDQLYVHFDLVGDVPASTYQYTDYTVESPVSIDVTSNSDLFWSQVNSNTLSPANVSITVIESSSNRFSGTYDFTGQDLGSYSGEFETVFDDYLR